MYKEVKAVMAQLLMLVVVMVLYRQAQSVTNSTNNCSGGKCKFLASTGTSISTTQTTAAVVNVSA